jgi:hypothetical protein
MLAADARRLLAALDLQIRTDHYMARDALRSAVLARDSMTFAEAIRLVDLAYDVLVEAAEDRMTRLRGMAVCVRMASAVLPLSPLSPVGLKLWRVRSLWSAGQVVHHVLVGAAERLLLRLWLLRVAYSLTLRAFLSGKKSVGKLPSALHGWRLCEDAVADWTGVLDPAHVESYRALLVDATERA